MQKNDEDQGPTELLERPREYNVKFRFPETSKLQPPILGLYETDFNYSGQAPLFKGVEFGIDMDSRIAIVGECMQPCPDDMTIDWRNPQVRLFSGCYSADSQTDNDRAKR